jgi:ABC-2 type transport system permease protein
MQPDRIALIVRTEGRRRVRAVLDDDGKRMQYVLIGGIVWLFAAPAAVFLAYEAGLEVAAGPAAGLPRITGLAFTAVLGASLFIQTSKAIQDDLLPTSSVPLLLAATHHEVILALLVVELGASVLLLGVPAVLAALAFGFGAGSPASVATILLATGCVLSVGVVAGVAIGLGLRTATARIPLLAKYRTLLSVGVFLGYLAALASGTLSVLVSWGAAAVESTPVGWIGHLALTAAVPVDTGKAALVGLAAVLGVVALVAVTTRLSGPLWYDDPVQPVAAERASAVGRLPGLERPTNAVLQAAWIRARRAPVRLLYVVYPAVFAIEPVASAIQSGTVPGWTPPALALYGAWATGAAFTLNPIGEEAQVFPATVTTKVTGRQHVRGRWLAGVVVGVPLTGLVVTAAGFLAAYTTLEVALVGILGLALPGLAPGLAAGFGARFPESETSEIIGSAEAVTPSTLAFVAFSIGVAMLALPIWAVSPGGVREWGAGLLGVPEPVAAAAGTALAVCVLALSAWAGARDAARRFDSYSPHEPGAAGKRL